MLLALVARLALLYHAVSGVYYLNRLSLGTRSETNVRSVCMSPRCATSTNGVDKSVFASLCDAKHHSAV